MDRVYVMQLVRSYQVGEMNRRTFLMRATAALGSLTAANMLLAACQPIQSASSPPPVVDEQATDAAAPETSPPEGMITAQVEYPDENGETLMGYLAMPDSEDPLPAVIVLQEWWGVDEHIRDVTNRLAAEGFIALAPDLYHGVVTTEPDEARKLVMELDMDNAVREISSAIDYLIAQEYVTGDTVGIVGFCMGGRLALMTSVEEDRLGAVVTFYGTPLSPEQAAGVQAPLLGLYGEEDTGIPVDSVLAMQEALDEAGITNEFHIYEGAPHAFLNDQRPSYHPEAAADAWERKLAWFREHLDDSM